MFGGAEGAYGRAEETATGGEKGAGVLEEGAGRMVRMDSHL